MVRQPDLYLEADQSNSRTGTANPGWSGTVVASLLPRTKARRNRLPSPEVRRSCTRSPADCLQMPELSQVQPQCCGSQRTARSGQRDEPPTLASGGAWQRRPQRLVGHAREVRTPRPETSRPTGARLTSHATPATQVVGQRHDRDSPCSVRSLAAGQNGWPLRTLRRPLRTVRIQPMAICGSINACLRSSAFHCVSLGAGCVNVFNCPVGSAPTGYIVDGSKTAVASMTLQGCTAISRFPPLPETSVTTMPAKATMS